MCIPSRTWCTAARGCRVPGYVWVNRMPGNIRLWTYSHAYLFSSLCQETQDINVSHHVDHVSFGTETVINFVKEHFAGTGFVSPLDGVHQLVEQSTTTTTPSTRRLYGSVGRNLGQASEVSPSTGRRWCPQRTCYCTEARSMCTSSRPTPTILPAGRRRPCICCLERDELRFVFFLFFAMTEDASDHRGPWHRLVC